MKRTALLLLMLALLLAGCRPSNPGPQPSPSAPPAQLELTQPATAQASATFTPTPEPSATPTPEPSPTATLPPQDYGPKDFPPGVNPLTGLAVTNPAVLDRRPVAIKLQLFPRGQRPVVGISAADIVYDYYQNNGLTRLTAVFYGEDTEQVGPIRSARLFDGAVVRMYKSIFAFGGADSRILTQLLNADYGSRLILEGSNACPALCRQDPNGFNYLIGNTAELSKYAAGRGVDNTRQDLSGTTFKHQPPANGQAGSKLSVRYSISAYLRWDYDPATGRYLRFQDAQEDDSGQGEVVAPFVDGLTGEQVGAENVVVLLATHDYFYRQGNNEIITIQLGGSGTAYAFRDGQAYQLLWNRPTPESMLFLTFTDGTPYPLKPGATWFQLLGQTANIQAPVDGAWRFIFRIP